MNANIKSFLQRWIVNTLGVLVAANVVRGIRYDTAVGLILASLLLGILNAFVRPIMILFALPLLIVTLGFFMLVINALLLYFVGGLLKTFHVDSFGAAFFGGVIISLVSLVVNWLVGGSDARIRFTRSSGPRRGPGHGPGPDDGSGPVIDV